jgi:hypothetical protein
MSRFSEGLTRLDVAGLTTDRDTGTVPPGTAAVYAPVVRKLCSPSRSHFLVATAQPTTVEAGTA